MKNDLKKKKLRIGLSSCFFHADPLRAVFKGKTLQYLEQSMAHWLQKSGVMAYLIPGPPVDAKVDLADYARDLDGLVLQGGSDVSPLSYGENPTKPEWSGDKIRDIYEIALVKEFSQLGKPILGVCRGLQLLNVAYGGSLYQDIEQEVVSAFKHRDWEIYDTNHHALDILPHTWLESWYQNPVKRVNSVHHQGIKRLAKDFVVEAQCPLDGMIEAIRYSGPSWIYGVQWHPEFQQGNPSLLDENIILYNFLTAVQNKKNEEIDTYADHH